MQKECIQLINPINKIRGLYTADFPLFIDSLSVSLHHLISSLLVLTIPNITGESTQYMFSYFAGVFFYLHVFSTVAPHRALGHRKKELQSH